MIRLGRSLVLFAIVFPSMVECVPAATPRPQVVRDDWYFRESLGAIRDWETILARWEDTAAGTQRTPTLPVPTSGEMVDWPDPIPYLLLPGEDRGLQVRVRLAGGKIEVARSGQGTETKRETIVPGEVVRGYQHPGGGGKDQWYHQYHRRFDLLTAFRPQPAPVALELKTPLDPQRGGNTLVFTARNVTERPLKLNFKLRFDSPRETRECGGQALTIAAGVAETLRFPFVLSDQGGGVLSLAVDCRDDSFWIPLFTYVENVTPVLESIERILGDTPDKVAAAGLAALRREVEDRRASGFLPNQTTWRSLFEEASRLRDALLLRRIRFDSLLFVKRKPFYSEQPFMDAHHLYNRPGGGIFRLSPVCPEGEVTPVVDSLGEGIYRDVCLHWSAGRFLFSFGNGSDQWDGKQSYHIYEVGVDGKGLRQLTFGKKNDCEPFYLPDGQVGFTSDRSEHFVMCGGDRHAPNLFVMNGDGSDVRQLSFNMFNDFTPSVLPDGRIIYGRWEYNERSVTSLHNPFTVNPDGTMMAPYYGNATIRPNVVMFPRPVPGSHKVTALLTAHHGQTHGAIGLIDVRRGLDGRNPLTVLTPDVPVTGERAEDSRYGWYSDPLPLSETTYLCCFTPTVLPWLERSWAVYLGDRHGNLALIYRDPEISCAEPVPLVPRRRPHTRPCATVADCDAEDAEATLLLADAYIGLPGVRRGAARYLRILEDVPRKSVPRGGVICTSGTPIYTVKRIFGTVPIEADGSAHFVVPADRNVYFEVVDEDYLEIQRMRSVVCLKPGERRTCIGCHEPRNMAPPNVAATAMRRPPSRPAPPSWGTRIVSFLRDVQPVLNAKCLGCHTHDRMANRVILTDDLTDQFSVGYEELLPYLKVANAFRWDHPDDVYPRPPYTYGSKVSRLQELLAAGHYGVELSEQDRQRIINWIDANGVYYDRYETGHYRNRSIFAAPVRKQLEEVYTRRCAPCHGENDGRHGTWWLSLNRRDAKLSRAVRAPLARSAGGWQRCDQVVFADTGDPDYAKLLAALAALHEALRQRPREDLLSLRGTAAERQKVTLPAPPPPRRPPDVRLPEGDWVHLSDLKWESARSGWSPNKDGLPRRDADIENHPLRLGMRTYPKGLGTHAPSEIVYDLQRRYSRFYCLVGGAEEGGTVVFRVLGDDAVLFDSGVMRGLRGVREIDVSVRNVRRLRLVVTDGGDNYSHDMANWAAARLLKTPDRDNQ